MVHADTINLSTQVGTTINRAKEVGLLTDAMVLGETTVQGLIDQILAVKVHADMENLKQLVVRVFSKDAGITDSSVAAADTIAGLVALTSAGASTAIDVLN
jgi:hypothetical protein